MTDNLKKWKPRLLSSSLPLEFEVSKVLTKHSFFVSHDYSYLRKEDNFYKEFSVDIEATAFLKVKKFYGDVKILAECKYREEGKRWAFLPDITSDFMDFVAGYTIRHQNAFSLKNINSNSISDFEKDFEFSVKGTEISLTTGDVFDKDIRHGILQLKYALPYVIKHEIEFNTFSHIEDARPFFIVPVLVTNAELFIFKKDITIERIKDSDNIDDLMKKVPYLILYSSIGPDFSEHHSNVFKSFDEELKTPNINIAEFEKAQKKFKNEYGGYHSPFEECENLANSETYTLNKNYTQFFVCSLEHFNEFVANLIKSIKLSIKV